MSVWKCLPRLFFIVIAASISLISGRGSAQNAVPMLINYQGELRDPATGEPVADGPYDMLFRIHDVESGGSALWEGAHTAANGNAVEVRSGVCSVIIGSGPGNALDPSTFDGADRWLEIQVGTETLSPRQRITSVAFSIVSDTARDADTVDGIEGADLEESAEIDADIAAHGVIPDAHHTRYTDAEAVAAMGPLEDSNSLNHDKTTALSWSSITGVPAGFADEEDNDTMYTAGAGLMLLDSQFNVEFAGTGSADAVSRSDHHHDGAYAPEAHSHDAGTIVSGMLDTGRFSAYDDLAAEGHLDGDAGTDLMTIDGGKGTYWALGGNGATNPGDHFVGTTDNQPLEIRVNNGRALRLEPGSSPNIIGGYVTNSAEAGAVGATVAGGGEAGFANRVTDDFGAVGGGRNNQAGDDAGTTSDKAYASVGGGAGNLSSGMYATVGGGLGNQAMADYATIAGGGRLDPGNPLLGNSVFDHYGSIGGGGNNRAGSDDGDATNATYATVGGGGTNWATGQGATVGGGFVNEASGFAATIPGGDSNIASGDYATIGGGTANKADGDYSTIAGGGPSDPANSATRNRVTDSYGTVAGGGNNQAGNDTGTPSDANFATVGGGQSNVAGAFSATVAGGAVNEASASWAAIGGGNWNKVADENGTVAGGNNNVAGTDDDDPANAKYATVGGGASNSAGAPYAMIGGGSDNQILIGGHDYFPDHATIGGGEGNTISFAGINYDYVGWWGTIGGGYHNKVGQTGGTVGGGYENTSDGAYSVVAGGENNKVDGDVWHASIGGGLDNTVSGPCGTIPGGEKNTAMGWYSLAAGHRAKANHKGAFVWGDSQDADITSTAVDQVTFRCLGGVRFLSGSGGANQMVAWAPGGSSWTFSSDRNLKENFVEVDAREVLDKLSALPIAEWNFKGYSQRHVGPVAQDFHALFSLGGSDTMIDSGDLQGVSLAAIQGLHKIAQERDVEISTLRKQNADLESRLAALEVLVQTLAKERKGGEQ